MNLLKSIVLISAGGLLSACVAMSQPQLQPKIQTEFFQIISLQQNGTGIYQSTSDIQLQTAIVKNWPLFLGQVKTVK